VSDCYGFRDIEGNEIADGLAKQAAVMDFSGPEPVLGLSITSVRNTVRQWSVQEQIRRWNSIQIVDRQVNYCKITVYNLQYTQ